MDVVLPSKYGAFLVLMNAQGKSLMCSRTKRAIPRIVINVESSASMARKWLEGSRCRRGGHLFRRFDELSLRTRMAVRILDRVRYRISACPDRLTADLLPSGAARPVSRPCVPKVQPEGDAFARPAHRHGGVPKSM